MHKDLFILVLHRTVRTLAVLVGVELVVFSLLALTGDPAAALLPPGTSASEVALYRHTLGLDQSLPAQFVHFLMRAFQGDFGTSLRDNQPALSLVIQRLPATGVLVLTTLVIAVVGGGAIGTAAALGRGRVSGQFVRLLVLIAQAIPSYWLGVLLILIVSVDLGWLPSSATGGLTPQTVILPALTLALQPCSVIARLIHANLLVTMREEWVRAARGRGIPFRRVVWKHALRVAILPALGYLNVQIGFLLGGTVIVETVFGYPGLGLLLTERLGERDVPVVLAIVTVISVAVIVSGLFIDILMTIIDPRMRG